MVGRSLQPQTTNVVEGAIVLAAAGQAVALILQAIIN
jgi:hypothetical protein